MQKTPRRTTSAPRTPKLPWGFDIDAHAALIERYGYTIVEARASTDQLLPADLAGAFAVARRRVLKAAV